MADQVGTAIDEIIDDSSDASRLALHDSSSDSSGRPTIDETSGDDQLLSATTKGDKLLAER